MKNNELPSNIREAQEIIEKAKAKTKDGWISAEEAKLVRAKLLKLGISIIDERSGKKKQTLVEDVQIHPWKKDMKGHYFNPWCVDAEGEDAGWNVHSFAPDGQGGGEIIDDDDFDDYESAFAHGEALAEKYGVSLRPRTLFMIV